MKTIPIATGKPYKVLIDHGLLKQAGSLLPKKDCTTVIVSDSNVWPLYGPALEENLTASGYQVLHHVFPAGESSKKPQTLLALLNFLAASHVTRKDLILALGGGVTGDLAGFAAAIYLRGMDYVQLPTSLLAMVDSSVGGKTAIDLEAGKNLAGAFHQPRMVLCDMDALDTLPPQIFRDGCAEVIKYGVLFDPTLFAHLEQQCTGFDRSYVIARCVELKEQVVSQDEFDRGPRQLLNLGHTLGHGVEAASNFTLSHGQAVAIGMVLAARAGSAWGLTHQDVLPRLLKILEDFGLPTATNYDSKTILQGALSDKKRSGSQINLIIPEEIGLCRIHPTAVALLPSFIEAGLF